VNSKNINTLIFLSTLLLLLFTPILQADVSESIETVTVRPGVSQSYLLLTPSDPVATVILFSGYGGYLNITQQGIQQPTNNFLVRTRELFAQQKILTAVIDTPSDFAGVDGILGWRATQTHAQDIQKIIISLRQKADIPIWLIGTSRGTISAANAAARLHINGPDGLVLTSTVVDSGGKNSGYIGDVALDNIRIPTLIIHHNEDDCVVSDIFGAQKLPAQLSNAPRVEFIAYDGGKTPESGSCGALSEHGFIGLETDVVKTITEWITR